MSRGGAGKGMCIRKVSRVQGVSTLGESEDVHLQKVEDHRQFVSQGERQYLQGHSQTRMDMRKNRPFLGFS